MAQEHLEALLKGEQTLQLRILRVELENVLTFSKFEFDFAGAPQPPASGAAAPATEAAGPTSNAVRHWVIGPNDAGKSNLFRAIDMALRRVRKQGGPVPNSYFHDDQKPMRIRFHLSDCSPGHDLATLAGRAHKLHGRAERNLPKLSQVTGVSNLVLEGTCDAGEELDWRPSFTLLPSQVEYPGDVMRIGRDLSNPFLGQPDSVGRVIEVGLQHSVTIVSQDLGHLDLIWRNLAMKHADAGERLQLVHELTLPGGSALPPAPPHHLSLVSCLERLVFDADGSRPLAQLNAVAAGLKWEFRAQSNPPSLLVKRLAPGPPARWLPLELFSGGQRQLLVLMCALCSPLCRRTNLLLDEPLASVDSASKRDFDIRLHPLVSAGWKPSSNTVIITHSPELVSVGDKLGARDVIHRFSRDGDGLTTARVLGGFPKTAMAEFQKSLPLRQMLFYDRVLLVEGPSDEQAVRQLLDQHQLHGFGVCQISALRNKGTKFVPVLGTAGIPYLFIIDADYVDGIKRRNTPPKALTEARKRAHDKIAEQAAADIPESLAGLLFCDGPPKGSKQPCQGLQAQLQTFCPALFKPDRGAVACFVKNLAGLVRGFDELQALCRHAVFGASGVHLDRLREGLLNYGHVFVWPFDCGTLELAFARGSNDKDCSPGRRWTSPSPRPDGDAVLELLSAIERRFGLKARGTRATP